MYKITIGKPRGAISPAGLPDDDVVRGHYKIAACFSSFLMALLIKSLIVVPVVATKAATRECSSDDIRVHKGTGTLYTTVFGLCQY